jgi:hypothetical protein
LATVVIQPLAVKSSDAWTMLGISRTHGYKLIADGDSSLEGRIAIMPRVDSVGAHSIRSGLPSPLPRLGLRHHAMALVDALVR